MDAQTEKTGKKTSLFARRFIRIFWGTFISLFLLVVLLFTLIALGVFGPMPSFEELENPKSNLASEVLADDHTILGSFYIQNRSGVTHDELSPHLSAALISTEDERFHSHSGIDVFGLGRVILKTVILRQRGAGGGSTISQQLAKNLFPRDTARSSNGLVRVSRLALAKFKEWITAVKLERNYTKDEILTMYLNTVPFGSNSFGIKMAARTFFSTTPDSLRVEEAALLVGLVKGPTRYSPVRHPERSLKRRNVVLGQMLKCERLTQKEYDSLTQLPLNLKYRMQDHNSGLATYYRELLRLQMTANKPKRENYSVREQYQADSLLWETSELYGWCNKNRKPDGTPYNLYRDGLKIYTPINAKLQRYAEEAIAQHLGGHLQPAFFREKKNSLFSYKVDKKMREQVIRHGIVRTERYRSMRAAGASQQQIDSAFHVKVKTTLFSWKGDIDTVITPYDSMVYMKKILRCGFIAMEPNSGRVRAYVGGNNFKYFKYDQVYVARRQIGSTIKPFLYTLAMQEGYSPCMKVPNVPQVFQVGNSTWTPKNSGKTRHDGEMVTLKWGLANSVNNISAWLVKQFTPHAVANLMHKMGIHSFIDPVWSIFLGTSLITNYELTAAYTAFASGGWHIDPLLVDRIEDKNGNIISRFYPEKRVVISPETAYLMVNLLRGVVDHGSGLRMRYIYKLKGPLGGKTGTTQNNADGWFMMIHPNIVLGTWVGAEDPQVFFNSIAYGQGASMALPIEGLFMQKAYADPSSGINENDQWAVPETLRGVSFSCNTTDSVAQEGDGGDEFF
ncbi:MAG: penicillin-binding protein [Bacteroidetes bacterium]|nr:MAG: penicillin-binding protein [Bacteroidota bacterium]